jgi:hypothetical protein
LTLHGSATFAWQADYGQFYLIDPEDAAFLAPVEITAAMEKRSLYAPAAGLVIYTQDSLQQHIRITVHDTEPDHPPTEPMSGNPWTRVETTQATFPSRRFTVSSPSTPFLLPGGPFFLLEVAASMVRVSWMEFQGSRDDSVPVEPDVIELTFWPA